VGALPPRESRWGRRARSRPFQVIAAGLVGLLLGAGLATAASAALFFHGHRHGARFSQPGPGFDGRDGGVPGGGQWYDRRQGPGRPNMRMPRRNRLPNGQFPGNPGDPGNPGNPTPPSPPAAPSEAPSPSASPSI
jgi:hypothetical protein